MPPLQKQYLRIVLGDGPDVREDFSRMDIDTIVSLPDFNHMREQLKALRVMDHDLQLLENMDEINTLKRESEISNEELLHLRLVVAFLRFYYALFLTINAIHCATERREIASMPARPAFARRME